MKGWCLHSCSSGMSSQRQTWLYWFPGKIQEWVQMWANPFKSRTHGNFELREYYAVLVFQQSRKGSDDQIWQILWNVCFRMHPAPYIKTRSCGHVALWGKMSVAAVARLVRSNTSSNTLFPALNFFKFTLDEYSVITSKWCQLALNHLIE